MSSESHPNASSEIGEKVMELLKAYAERDGVVVYSSMEPSETKYASSREQGEEVVEISFVGWLDSKLHRL